MTEPIRIIHKGCHYGLCGYSRSRFYISITIWFPALWWCFEMQSCFSILYFLYHSRCTPLDLSLMIL